MTKGKATTTHTPPTTIYNIQGNGKRAQSQTNLEKRRWRILNCFRGIPVVGGVFYVKSVKLSLVVVVEHEKGQGSLEAEIHFIVVE